MTELNQETATETLAAVRTPADVARDLVKLIVKLDRADIKAAEHDVEAKKFNEEIVAIATGTQEQTLERSMTHVAKDVAKHQGRAAAIREKTGDDAISVRDGFLELQGDVVRMLAGYKLSLEVEAEGEEADAPEADTESEEIED